MYGQYKQQVDTQGAGKVFDSFDQAHVQESSIFEDKMIDEPIMDESAKQYTLICQPKTFSPSLGQQGFKGQKYSVMYQFSNRLDQARMTINNVRSQSIVLSWVDSVGLPVLDTSKDREIIVKLIEVNSSQEYDYVEVGKATIPANIIQLSYNNIETPQKPYMI